jgi:hypothetical protein
MALTPEDCLAYARGCEERAKEITDQLVKATLLDLAEQWRELARYIKKRPGLLLN